MGMKFHVETDHKPLVLLLNSKQLDKLPLCVQHFCMRILRYHFSISHVQGKNLIMADTLSKAPVPGEVDQESQQEDV